MSLRDRLQADLLVAMKSRDARLTSVLRGALSAVSNAEAVEVTSPSKLRLGTGSTEVPRRQLTEADIVDVVGSERDELTSSATEMQDLGQIDRAADLRAQADILTAYLDQEMPSSLR